MYWLVRTARNGSQDLFTCQKFQISINSVPKNEYLIAIPFEREVNLSIDGRRGKVWPGVIYRQNNKSAVQN